MIDGNLINSFLLIRDGATRCGPFFVVYNVLEQISMDREVDIFTAVRQIQIRRPECVSTVVSITAILIFNIVLRRYKLKINEFKIFLLVEL